MSLIKQTLSKDWRITKDGLLDGFTFLTLASVWLFTFFSYNRLPDDVPIHYNDNGQVDGYCSKNIIWVETIVATLIFIGLSLINRYSAISNTVKTHEQDPERQQMLASRLLRVFKMFIVGVFSIILMYTVKGAETGHSGLENWQVLLIIGFLAGSLLIYLYFTQRKALQLLRNKTV